MNRSRKFSPIASLIAVFGALLAPPAAMAVPIQTRGHTDIRFTYENGTPDILYYLDVGSTVDGQSISSANPAGGTPVTLSGGQTKIAFQPTELITYIPNPSIARPSGTTWDFTGTSAGQPLWYIPQNQDTNKPWTGLSTESVSASNFSTIRYQLTAFNGPGQMSVTTTGSFGTPTVYFQTSNGLSNADAITISPNTHAHYNWFFTDAGVYTFELTATGTFTAAAGGGTTSVVDAFTFFVVPEPVSCLTMCIGIIGVLTSVVIHRLRPARTCR